jgi:hypothetical protein
MGNPNPLLGLDEIRQITPHQVQTLWDVCRQVRPRKPLNIVFGDPSQTGLNWYCLRLTHFPARVVCKSGT